MKSRFKIAKAFFKKEILQVLRDPRMRMVLFLAPLIQLTIFGIALSSETRNIRLAVWGQNSDSEVQDIYKRALNTKWFIPARVEGTDPFEWVKSGAADAVIVAPYESLLKGAEKKQRKLQLLINAKNNSRALAIENYVNAVARDVLDSDKPNHQSGIIFETRALYNPSFETAFFMIPGVMSMLVCLVTILLTSMGVAREKEIGTIETLTSSPIDSWDLLLGKTLPFIFLGLIQTALIFSFAVFVFSLPVRGPLWMVFASSLLMILATVVIGILISTIANNQQQAMLAGFLYLFPSYLLSGLMFPVENMPIYIQPFSYINPLTHYMGLLRNILLVGGDNSYFVIHSAALIGMILCLGWIALRRFKKMVA